MKNESPNIKGLTAFVATIALAAAISSPSISIAQEKGAAQLIQHNRFGAVQKTGAVQAVDTKAMTCPKCKDSWVTIVQKSCKTGVKPDSIKVQRHECPGCNTKLVTQGTGKHAVTKILHVCDKCGSADAFCCVTKVGAGPIPGMDKE